MNYNTGSVYTAHGYLEAKHKNKTNEHINEYHRGITIN